MVRAAVAAATFTPPSVTNYGIQGFREIQFEKQHPAELGALYPPLRNATAIGDATREN